MELGLLTSGASKTKGRAKEAAVGRGRGGEVAAPVMELPNVGAVDDARHGHVTAPAAPVHLKSNEGV